MNEAARKDKIQNYFKLAIGYTNAGKSTILNMLTTAGTYSEDQLFATLDPLTKMAIASRHGSYADRYGWLHSRFTNTAD